MSKKKKQNWRDVFTTVKMVCKTCNRRFEMNYATMVMDDAKNKLTCHACGDQLHSIRR